MSLKMHIFKNGGIIISMYSKRWGRCLNYDVKHM